MKTWFGVLARSCLEFILISAIASLVVGASANLGSLPASAPRLLAFARLSIIYNLPFAAALTIFLTAFSFERRVRSRLAGWLGQILLGLALFSAGLALDRWAMIEALLRPQAGAPLSAGPGPQKPSIAVESEGRFLWYRAVEGDRALDVVTFDANAPAPKLEYEPAARFDPSASAIELEDSRWPASAWKPRKTELAPEAAIFSDSWLWVRLAGMKDASFLLAAAAALGFVLLAAGFRFFARLTRWPLANAFFGLAGFLGLLALDAAIGSDTAAALVAGLAGKGGLSVPPVLLAAAAEAALGLVLGLLDLAIAPKQGGDRG